MKLAHLPAVDEPHLDEAAPRALLEGLDSLRVAVTVFDSAERLIYCSLHFNYLFRSMPRRSELLGLSYAQMIRLEVAGGEIGDPEATRDLDGYIAWRRAQFVEGSYRALDIRLSDGRIVEIKPRRSLKGGWIALWADVTQARQAQARLEDALALSADAFAFFDKDDRLAMCNELYAAIYGYQAAADARGTDFRKTLDKAVAHEFFLMPAGAEEWIARLMEIHRAPAGVFMVETASGGAYLVRDRATEGGGRVVILTDVTDRRRVETALAEQTKALAESRNEAAAQANYLADLTRRFDEAAADVDTTKITLLRTMSHELKTPLNAIIGFSDLMIAMADRFGPEQVQEYAALIHEGGRNLLRLINQILDLTRLSAGRYELNRSTIDAGRVLWVARNAFDARAGAKNIVLDASAAPCGFMVEADETAFTSMIFQLVENAISFTHAGGTVRLSAAREGATVRVCVSDNGPGVAKADLARILRPFEQGGRSTTDHTAGAGLGLTLVKALAELHGGSLGIESTPGEGFSATIVLPAKA